MCTRMETMPSLSTYDVLVDNNSFFHEVRLVDDGLGVVSMIDSNDYGS